MTGSHSIKRKIVLFQVFLLVVAIIIPFAVLAFGVANGMVIEDQPVGPVLRIRELSLARGGFLLVTYPKANNPNKWVLLGYIPAGRYRDILLPQRTEIQYKPGGKYTIKPGDEGVFEMYGNIGSVLTTMDLVPNYYPETVVALTDLSGNRLKKTIVYQ